MGKELQPGETRHDYFKRRLKEMGLYDKDSDYSGMIGEWVEELSETFKSQHHSGMSAMTTLAVFDQLVREYNEEPKTYGQGQPEIRQER